MGHIISNFMKEVCSFFMMLSMHLACDIPLCFLFLRLVFSFYFRLDVIDIFYNCNLTGHAALKGIFDGLDDIKHLLFSPHS